MKLLTAVILAAAIATTAVAATVRLSAEAAVTGPKVTLADVAAIETPNAAESARMAGVVVAFLPKDDAEIEVNTETVRQALSGAGINVAGVDICGAASARVNRAKYTGRTAGIVRAVEKYTAAATAGKRAVVSEISIDFEAPADFRPTVICARPKELEGQVRFDIADARMSGKTVGHVFGTVSRSVPVIVAKHRIFGGTLVTLDDVTVEYKAASEAEDPVGETSDAVGHRLLETVDAGRPITQRMLESVDVVKRGDEVTLECKKGGMTVSVKTTALQNACGGDVVRLKRPGGRAEVLAKVTGAGRAVPVTGGKE